ncbi:MAG: response regulator [Nitrospirae bacterium]|nr:response regulator [Nitrospirota bacterium]
MGTQTITDNSDARILVVDDLPFNLEVMEGFLYKEGYTVITALNALEALEIIAKQRVDLAVLDVMMPGMNGFDLCRKIKSVFGNRFFPVILVTALDELKDKITGLEAGADDFLTKPFHTIELMTKIRSLLRLRKLQSELDHSEDIILSLAIAIESKDIYTKGHSERVGTLSMELASFLGMSEEDRNLLFKAGVLHDIGKIGVDNTLLHKTGPLSDADIRTIQEHVLIGETICFPLNSARNILPVIRHHHERWDGTGFPDRLSGEEIPFFARITAITDTFDAMVSSRPYRKSYTVMEALEIMGNEKPLGQWDPQLLDGFTEMMIQHKEFCV